jgi:hypothetical protein
MKTQLFQTVCVVVAVLVTALATGCGERHASLSQPTQTQATNIKPDPAIKTLEAQVGMAFPTNAVLVNSGDGGGREASHMFYEWAVFSPTQIKMPPRQGFAKDYLNLPLEDTVKFVEVTMGGRRKIEEPQVALSSDWQTNGFAFGGTLIRSSKGDYLVIQRGRIK